MTSDAQILATAAMGIRNLVTEIEDCIARWRKIDVPSMIRSRPDEVLRIYHALNEFRATCLSVSVVPEKTETCVLCASDTGIHPDTPLNLREHYVEGCGQLCPMCAAKIR